MTPKANYLTPGNAKLGNIWSFDLTPIMTCPGATDACKKDCYAVRMYNQYLAVRAKYMRNDHFSRHPDFVEYMIRNIPYGVTFRIHVSGDFYSDEYIRNWILIATMRRDVQFYAYTRSWRLPELVDSLILLGDMKNVTLNLSTDKDSGQPKGKLRKFRVTHMTDDDTAPPLTRDDIIFRVNSGSAPGGYATKHKKDPVKYPLIHNISGAPVCPKERGEKIPLTCAQCAICINKSSACQK